MSNKIQLRRGNKADLPTLAAGEPGFCLDTGEFFIGDGATNHQAVMHALFGAQSILAATSDDTPAALTIGEQTIVGRKTGGNVAALSASEVLGIINVESGADITDADNVDSAGAVMNNDFDAGTLLYATSDNTPEAKTRAQILALLSGQASAAFAMNSQKITGGATPTEGTDFAIKSYVDSVAQGLNVHDSVACATVENITLSAEQTIDGILTSESRVLVKSQTDATENGIYVSGSGAWSRADDLDADAEVAGSFVFVTGGTTLGNTGWVCTNEPEAAVVGTNDITFAQFSDAGYIDAGTGLVKSGNTISATGVLEDLAALAAPAAGEFIKGSGAGTFAYRSAAEVLTDLSAQASANFSFNSKRITAVADPVDDQDAATKKWVGDNFGAGSSTFIALTDTPSNFTGSAGKLAVVNSTPDALEFVSITTFLEGTPTEDLGTKAPTSEWAYDHNAASTGVHGAGANTLLNSASDIDGGSFV